MSVKRLEDIPGFHIDRVAAAAADDPDVLRLENLDTDIRPPAAAVEATRAALDEDEANSWLPFTGRDDLKDAVAHSSSDEAALATTGPGRLSSHRARVSPCSTLSSASRIQATRSS